jgi:hypothetical protein
MESLMINKLDLMQKETNLELLPTYAFWRMYTLNADLKKHTDRESCEISVTVMIGSDGTKWPIYMNGNKIELEEGDAVIYLGCELEHWREEFKGDWHAQTFLHYVDKNGKNKEFLKIKELCMEQDLHFDLKSKVIPRETFILTSKFNNKKIIDNLINYVKNNINLDLSHKTHVKGNFTGF